MRKSNLIFAAGLGFFLCVLSSCGDGLNSSTKGDYKQIDSKTISLKDFGDDAELYMFVYNTSDTTQSSEAYSNIYEATAAASRSIAMESPTVYNPPVEMYDEFAPYNCGLSLKTVRKAMEGKSIRKTAPNRAASGSSTKYDRTTYKEAAEVGDMEEFIIVYVSEDGTEEYHYIVGTCRYVNDTCQVFVETAQYNENADDYYINDYFYEDYLMKESYYQSDSEKYNSIKVTPAGVEKIAQKFSAIYDDEQILLGYASLDFIKDENSNIIETPEKITILISNIGKKKNSATLGYFYPEDLRCDCDSSFLIDTNTKDENGNELYYYTNRRLMFTINTIGYSDKFGGENAIYSTLAHEFNHMINYINKVLRYGKQDGFETWFTEMLSVTTEDFAYELLKIPNTVQNARLRYFLRYPYSGMINWGATDVSNSYGFAYAFGAYLVRNYGGAKLLNEIATNKFAGKEAINEALKKCGYSETYESVLKNFGTIFLNADGGKYDFATLNTSSSTTVDGIRYYFPSVDLYEFSCKPKAESDEKFTEYLANPKWYDGYYKGPCFYKPANPPEKIYGGGFYASYLGKAGDFGGELKFNPPDEKSGIKAYLFIEY